ncbi:MAG: hypothetical protein HYZ16_03820 [Bacteroidetes bacterium]|nr:hypothetical protein [Bacteroidota bacterium]
MRENLRQRMGLAKSGLMCALLLSMLGMGSCLDGEEEKATLSVRLNWRNDYEGQHGPMFSGSQEDLPTEISVKAGAMVLFSINISTPEDNPATGLRLSLTSSSGVVRAANTIIKASAYTYAHPAEESFEAYFTLYTASGDSVKEGPLKVQVANANSTMIGSAATIAAPHSCSAVGTTGLNAAYFFVAPYYEMPGMTAGPNEAFGCSSASGLSANEEDRSQFAIFGAYTDSASFQLVSSDEYRQQGYLDEYFDNFPALGFNGAEFEPLAIPAHPDIFLTIPDFELAIDSLGFGTFASLEALTFSSPANVLTVTQGGWFKFRTVFGTHGVGIAWTPLGGKAVAINYVMQR